MNGSARTAVILIGVMVAIGMLFNPTNSAVKAQDSDGYWQLLNIEVNEIKDSITKCRDEGGYISKKGKNSAGYHVKNECNDPKIVEGWPLLWESNVEWRTPPEQLTPGEKVPMRVYVNFLYNYSTEEPKDFINIKLSGGDGKTIQTIIDIPLAPIIKGGVTKESDFIVPGINDLSKSAGNRILILVTTRSGQVSYIYEWVQGELKEEESAEENGEETEEPEGEEQVDGTAEPTKSSRTRPTPTLPTGCEDSKTRFSDLSGKVDVARSDDPEDYDSAELNMVLCAGDHVRTGRNSSAILSMGDLTTYVMRENSHIILDEPLKHDSKIKVVAGNIWINIKKTLKDGSMEVIMNEAVCGIKGTTFVVEETGSESRLKVIEGVVAFTSLADGESLDVGMGDTIAATEEGLGEMESFDIAAEEAVWQEYLDRDGSKTTIFDSIGASVPVMAGAGLCGCLGVGGLLAIAVIFLRRRRKTDAPQPVELRPEAMGKQCPQCGSPIQPGAAYCKNCGRKLA